jgi:hypothetical protein
MPHNIRWKVEDIRMCIEYCWKMGAGR